MLAAFYNHAVFPGNWDRLIQQASVEGLLPALADRSRALGIEARLPAEVRDVFTAAESLNAERNRCMLSEAAHVAALLNQIGIQPVALKGLAYLLTGTYPNVGTRYLLDIDLLIPPAQLERAAAHLGQNGYFESEAGRLIQFRHHHPGLRRAGSPIVELHHRVGQGVCHLLLPVSDILASAQALAYGGATFLIPSPTNLVNHLILHSQLAHPYDHRIFPPLQGFVDLAQLQNRFGCQIDWSGLAKTYSENGEAATLSLHLRHAAATIGLKGVEIAPLGRCSSLALRWKRRQLLNRHPILRFFDPLYLLLSFFSRRLRLLPQILSHPRSWPHVLRTVARPAFYRNLFIV